MVANSTLAASGCRQYLPTVFSYSLGNGLGVATEAAKANLKGRLDDKSSFIRYGARGA